MKIKKTIFSFEIEMSMSELQELKHMYPNLYSMFLIHLKAVDLV